MSKTISIILISILLAGFSFAQKKPKNLLKVDTRLVSVGNCQVTAIFFISAERLPCRLNFLRERRAGRIAGKLNAFAA